MQLKNPIIPQSRQRLSERLGEGFAPGHYLKELKAGDVVEVVSTESMVNAVEPTN